ncbi:hypothetical protein [Burkholderia gladioli]|jgi:hypothetical protein|nr:hypothetical protein [Burkholderia gladioli]MDN7812478.1 hypothetical protein [Burkholderia gladioli]
MKIRAGAPSPCPALAGAMPSSGSDPAFIALPAEYFPMILEPV